MVIKDHFGSFHFTHEETEAQREEEIYSGNTIGHGLGWEQVPCPRVSVSQGQRLVSSVGFSRVAFSNWVYVNSRSSTPYLCEFR